MRTPRIVAFDLETGRVLRNQALPPAVAPKGSCLQDLAVSADGGTIVIADSSLWRKRPALIVYDVETGDARRVLENHPAVAAENFRVRTRSRDMTFLGGIVSLRGGVAGVALHEDWLYFSAMTGSGLYRVPLADLRDRDLPAQALAAKVERVADKPLSDGISVDTPGNVYLTDIEHGAISIVDTDRRLRTLIRSEALRWPDGLSFGPDGWLYVADSALPDVVLMSRERVAAAGPYRIFRFRPGTEGVPGH
jgi:sugar lactone lactonase YvrE